jgi:magnesium-transporting ATPase (P-type)
VKVNRIRVEMALANNYNDDSALELGSIEDQRKRYVPTPIESIIPTSPSSLFCTLSKAETATRLHASLKDGLASQQDAVYRKSIHGTNVLEGEQRQALWRKFFAQIKESPLILLLFASALVSLLMGNIDDAFSITLVAYMDFIC